MPAPNKTVQRACQRLRRLVRFREAKFALPVIEGGVTFPAIGKMSNDADTEAIREATRLYMETWVVPLLDAIERGDLESMRRNSMRGQRVEHMETEVKP